MASIAVDDDDDDASNVLLGGGGKHNSVNCRLIGLRSNKTVCSNFSKPSNWCNAWAKGCCEMDGKLLLLLCEA
jgi:hypothetical protein